jgi:hypothetical protein
MEIFLEVTVSQLTAVFLLIQNDSIMPSIRKAYTLQIFR